MRAATVQPSTLIAIMWEVLLHSVHSFAADLTRKRVRGHAILLGVIVWGAYAINISTLGLMDREGQLKGADFLHFYVLGHIARLHDGGMLYDAHRQTSLAAQLIHQQPNETYLPVYGPQYSLVFLPLTALPYGWAAAVWMLGSALAYFVCCGLLLKACPRLKDDRISVFLLAAAFPGFFYLVASGQNAAIALVAFTASYLCFRGKQPFLAGMALGLLMYKPQFGVMAAVLFVLTLEWKVILGALITGGGQLAAGAVYYGRPILDSYLHGIVHVNQNASALEPHLDRLHGLMAFWQLLLPWHGVVLALYVLTAIPVIGITVWCWRSKAPFELRYSVFLLGSALVNPHLTDYDLVTVMPAFLLIGDQVLLSDASVERDEARVLTYAAYCLPLFGPLLKTFHLQLSVPAYAALFLVVAIVIRKRAGGAAESASVNAAAVSSLGA
jgi:alpha-1,2-mannosyltransferase